MKKRQVITLIVESDEGVEYSFKHSFANPNMLSLVFKGGNPITVATPVIEVQPDPDPAIAKDAHEDNLPHDLTHHQDCGCTECKVPSWDNTAIKKEFGRWEGKETPTPEEPVCDCDDDGNSHILDCPACSPKPCDYPGCYGRGYIDIPASRPSDGKDNPDYYKPKDCPKCKDPAFMSEDDHAPGLTVDEKIVKHTGDVMDALHDIMSGNTPEFTKIIPIAGKQL